MMNPTIFLVLLFLPSFFFAFAVLTTFYGEERAFLLLSWVPLAFFALLLAFGRMFEFQNLPSQTLAQLLNVVRWMSLVQSLCGVGLIVRAIARKQGIGGLFLASCLTALPFIWRTSFF